MKTSADLQILGTVVAGFPVNADEELVDTISLDEYLIEDKNATYLIKVVGGSMRDAGILPGDIAIVERGRRPQAGDIVIAEIDSEYKMMRFEHKPRKEIRIEAVVRGVVRKY